MSRFKWDISGLFSFLLATCTCNHTCLYLWRTRLAHSAVDKGWSSASRDDTLHLNETNDLMHFEDGHLLVFK